MIFAAAAALALIAVGALWYVVRGFARGREFDRALDADGAGLGWAILIAVGAEVGAAALIVLAVALIT